MSLEAVVRNQMNEALRTGNKEARLVYSSIVTALTNKSKELFPVSESHNELSAEQEIEVISKLAKQNKESIDSCPMDRIELLEKLNFEKNILVQFLPEQMSEDEIRQTISDILVELGLTNFENKDKGSIMKSLMPKTKGKADGKLVNQILESFRS